MSVEYLGFERWKIVLRENCVREGKLFAFDAMGDYALRLFWERGTEPTVQGILSEKDTNKEAPNARQL